MYIVKIPLFNDNLENDKNNSSNNTTSDSNNIITTHKCNNKCPFKKYQFCWDNKDLTYVMCWNCSFELLVSECVGIPTIIQNSKFVCYGYFCSFECAARYLYDTLFVQKPDEYYNEYSLLCMARNILYNNDDETKDNQSSYIPPLEMAPPRMVLKNFGGTVSYEEYRHHPKNIEFYRLPLVPLDVYIMNMSS